MISSQKSTALNTYLLITFFVLSFGILLAGYFYFETIRTNYIESERQSLSVIAEFQSKELTQWRKERIGDAANIANNELMLELLRQSSHGRVQINLHNQVDRWLRAVQLQNQYDRIAVVDRSQRVILATPEEGINIARRVLQTIAEAESTGKITFVDFHRNEFNNRIYLSIIIPITEFGSSKKFLGSVILRIDPEIYLFPLMERSSDLNSNLVTLLVRRDKDEVLFLHSLDDSVNAALKMRIPIQNKEVVAVQAVLGARGNVEGVDYRGIPVYGCVMPIQNSPWFLIAKVDKQVVHNLATENLLIVIFVVAILILATGSVIGYAIRHQQLGYLREKYKSVQQVAFLREIIQNSLNEIYIFHPETLQCTFANDVACTNLGYTMEELLGKNIRSIRADVSEEEYRQIPKQMESDAKTMMVTETTHRRKNGTTYPVEAHYQLTATDEGNFFVAIANDITSRKQSERKIQRALKELERSNKELEQFAYVASHDLQEPLRMVASYTQLIERRYKDKLDSDANEFIRFAVEGAMRMQRLISDLLEYSRLSTRKKDFEPIDVHSVLGEVIVNLLFKIQETSAIITNEDLPEIYADRSQIVRLFQNLIDNALKYKKNDIIPRIHISSVEHDDHYEFMINDNGIGIDPKYQERVFIIFQRLHNKEEYGGSGIGLAICKKIAERHGGTIWFESVPGEGTTFHITFAKIVQDDNNKS